MERSWESVVFGFEIFWDKGCRFGWNFNKRILVFYFYTSLKVDNISMIYIYVCYCCTKDGILEKKFRCNKKLSSQFVFKSKAIFFVNFLYQDISISIQRSNITLRNSRSRNIPTNHIAWLSTVIIFYHTISIYNVH